MVHHSFPLQIEKIGEAFRGVFTLYHRRVVGDHAQRRADGRVEPVRVTVLWRDVAGNIFRHVGR